jgi:hypothetical protein
MPAHSLQSLQPRDFGWLSPLKRTYSHEIESLIRHQVNHITKLESLPAINIAFDSAFTPANLQ